MYVCAVGVVNSSAICAFMIISWVVKKGNVVM